MVTQEEIELEQITKEMLEDAFKVLVAVEAVTTVSRAARHRHAFNPRIEAKIQRLSSEIKSALEMWGGDLFDVGAVPGTPEFREAMGYGDK